jgi:hypothetical protein
MRPIRQKQISRKAAKDAKEVQERCKSDWFWFSFALLAIFA